MFPCPMAFWATSSGVTPAMIKPTVGSSWTSYAQAYDISTSNDLTTSATSSISKTNQAGTFSSLLNLTTFQTPAVQSYASKKLHVNWSISAYNDPATDGPALSIEISIDGTTYSVPLWNGSDPAEFSSTGSGQCWVELGASQDTSLVKVRPRLDLVSSGTGGTTNITGNIFDVWINCT